MANQLKKPFLWLMLLLVVLAFPVLRFTMKQGVFVGNVFLVRESENVYALDETHRVSFEQTEAGMAFDVLLGSVSRQGTLAWEGNQATLTYEDGTVVEGAWYQNGQLLDAEGVPLYVNDQTPLGAIDDTNVSISLSTLSDCLCRMDKDWTQTYGATPRVLLGIIMYVLGCADFLWPEKMHKKIERWHASDAELTKEGRAARKASGLVVMIIGVGVMYAQLFR